MAIKVRCVFTENPWATDSGKTRHVTGTYDHVICHSNGRILGMDHEHSGKRDQVTLIAELMVAHTNKARGKVPLFEVTLQDNSTLYYESMIVTEEGNVTD